jgi:hypothetical protein
MVDLRKNIEREFEARQINRTQTLTNTGRKLKCKEGLYRWWSCWSTGRGGNFGKVIQYASPHKQTDGHKTQQAVATKIFMLKKAAYLAFRLHHRLHLRLITPLSKNRKEVSKMKCKGEMRQEK